MKGYLFKPCHAIKNSILLSNALLGNLLCISMLPQIVAALLSWHWYLLLLPICYNKVFTSEKISYITHFRMDKFHYFNKLQELKVVSVTFHSNSSTRQFCSQNGRPLEPLVPMGRPCYVGGWNYTHW